MELEAIRQINAKLPFADPIALGSGTWISRALPGRTFDPEAPKLEDFDRALLIGSISSGPFPWANGDRFTFDAPLDAS